MSERAAHTEVATASRGWGMRFRAREWLDRSWLVVPAVYVVAALALGKIVPELEEGSTSDPLALDLTADNAREILNAVAGGMIAFTGLVVSVAVVVVQFGAGQYSPRLVLRFRRDLLVKHALGMFIAPALYALVTLGSVGQGDQPGPGVTVGLAIALLVVAVLAFFTLVARLLDLLRPRRLYARLLAGCEGAIDQVYPLPFEPGAEQPPELAEVTRTVNYDGGGGVVSALDRGRLVGAAQKSGAVVESALAVGGYVWPGAPLVRVRGGDGQIPEAELRRSIIVAEERTLVQDPAFAIRAIVDISIRALSPATNDPTTGTQALDTLESILHLLGERHLGAGYVHDEAGELRLVYHAPDWQDLLELSLTE
ncbi:MAG TPA: DUF2254 family protein, partial [Thermoleophilaceae bacterium]|nr:DUF2254 family protein [Thermoleophilaceae bacterium]